MHTQLNFLQVVCVGLLIISSLANAGLIIGNQEFLDFNITTGKSVAQVENLIESNMKLSGYSLATDVDMSMLYSMIPETKSSYSGYNSLNISSYNHNTLKILNFFIKGFGSQYTRISTLISENGETVFFNKDNNGLISYLDAQTGEYESGYYNIKSLNGVATAIYNRSGSQYDLTDINTTSGNYAIYHGSNVHSLFVRTINVPEPSTIVLISLGLLTI